MIDLPANRRLTKHFIDQLPVVVTLTPRSRVSKPAGGFVWAEQAPRAPQTFTIIEQPADPVPTVTVDGVERQIEFVLLGEHDAQIGREDVFTHQGKDCRVIELAYENGWERRATVVARG